MATDKLEQLKQLIFLVTELSGTLNLWGDAFSADLGLTSAKWQVLSALDGKRKTSPQIAATFGITRQAVQLQLNQLLKEGLIETFDNPHHKRSMLYGLTAKGQTAYDELYCRWRQQAKMWLDLFDSQALGHAHSALNTLLQQVKNKDKNDPNYPTTTATPQYPPF
ncbi:MarR family winged helix-turn-helix transcriptional regulator [Neisseria perflava]|uniref:MarR family winged helix-turn-helix transcriptional regulator n=1 Tax=Neisseria perflava TaxID=33053 RepID=UPI0020A1109D|nr:MarR family winged helix-turn-helix transcriptional regulator [Neisseria perflava]MCP1659426.1 DNA-binding MarR family transcriptional regulator [Neisseria perflava]MCP1772266.1 DNA-binding MarR family transcriptional regulator [Neisseria perflava]